MKRSINHRLSQISLIAIVLTAIGVTLVCYALFRQQVRQDLRRIARIVAETGVFREVSPDKLRETKHLFSADDVRITWIDADGTVLLDNDTSASDLANHRDRPEIRLALADGEGESTRHSDTMNMDTLYYALLLDNGTVLRVSMQARTALSLLLTALPVIFGIAVLVLLGCVLLGHLLTGRLMKPIEEMAENLNKTGEVPLYKELEPFARKIRSQHENILAAAKSRQDFTANISHELKTPIAAISGYAELIENRLVDAASEVHVAKQIRHNAERLLSIITDSIRLSELDHSELPRAFAPTDLYALARDCVSDLGPLAQRRGIVLRCTGESVDVHGDAALLRELTDNLVQNAIRYNKDHGSVLVTVAVRQGRAVLSVKDSGIGIPADQQERIFERFYRVDKSRSRETGGTGLGLAIVKHIAELHNAEITVNSSPGVGTEIVVSF